jgi:hypothetical protein
MGPHPSSPILTSTSFWRWWAKWLDSPPVREREFKRFVVLALTYRAINLLTMLGSLFSFPPSITRQPGVVAVVMLVLVAANFALIPIVLRKR